MGSILIVDVDDANNLICYAFMEQTTQETPALLLGGLPKVWQKGEAEAGNDSHCVHINPVLPQFLSNFNFPSNIACEQVTQYRMT